jgi:hypothetical protein
MSTATQTPPSAYGRPLIQVARELGKHLATMHRWRQRGVTDSHGVRHYPMMTRIGGQWYVRDEDLAAFFEALSGESLSSAQAATKPTRSAERASRELDAIGI